MLDGLLDAIYMHSLHHFGWSFPAAVSIYFSNAQCNSVWLSHFSIRVQFYLSGTTQTVKSDMCAVLHNFLLSRRVPTDVFFFPLYFRPVCTCAQLKTKTIYFIISLQQIKTWCKKEIMKNMILKLITVSLRLCLQMTGYMWSCANFCGISVSM